jgi:tetratricopeptide (TPR) repeat protein
LLVATGIPGWSQGVSEAGALQGLPGLDGSLGRGLTGGFGAGRSAGAAAGVSSAVRPAQVDEETARAYGERANSFYAQAKAAQKKGKLAQAEKLYKQSLKLRETVWGSQDPAVPTILIVVSELEQKQGKLADAEQSAQRALAMMTRMYGAASQYVKPAERQLAKVTAARRTSGK